VQRAAQKAVAESAVNFLEDPVDCQCRLSEGKYKKAGLIQSALSLLVLAAPDLRAARKGRRKNLTIAVFTVRGKNYHKAWFVERRWLLRGRGALVWSGWSGSELVASYLNKIKTWKIL
jgi:hypothetical protein